jgi:hypothetical protein
MSGGSGEDIDDIMEQELQKIRLQALEHKMTATEQAQKFVDEADLARESGDLDKMEMADDLAKVHEEMGKIWSEIEKLAEQFYANSRTDRVVLFGILTMVLKVLNKPELEAEARRLVRENNRILRSLLGE